jgi:hypothetical protein
VAEFWREPITNAHPAFAGDIPHIPGVPQLRWLIDEENALWIAQGKGCSVCLCKFPDRPMKGNEDQFRGIEYGRSWPEVRKLIRDEKCPVCMSDVSPEMARALNVADVWTNPAKPGKVLK